MRKYLLFLIIACSTPLLSETSAQIISSTRVDTFTYHGNIHSPIRAAMLSAAIPGMGQIYNRKYWKVPLIYAGTGTLLYFINLWDNEYKLYRDAFYDARYGGFLSEEFLETLDNKDPEINDQLISNIEKRKNEVQKWRNYNMLGLAALYLANIIDAHIDAYFLNFDVNKDLTVQLDPYVDKSLLSENIIGLKLTLKIN